MKLLLALLLMPTLCVSQRIFHYSDCIGDGSRIVEFPTGAYVPDAWIDMAVDSVGEWRYNADRHAIARRIIVDQNKREAMLMSLIDSTDAAHEREVKAYELSLGLAQRDAQFYEDKVGRLKPWATIGKVSVGLASLITILGVYAYVRP